MKAYLGAKIILAERMDEITFGREFRKTTPAEGQVSQSGYHVQYSNPDGSTYDAWSPTEVFERAYREVSADEKELIVK